MITETDLKVRYRQELIVEEKTIKDWQDMISVYQARIDKYGIGYKSLFYPNEALYTAKLAHVSRILHEEISPQNSILDVGCGTGNLIPFMPPCTYRGIDLVEEFVEEARKNYPDLSFDCINVMELDEKYDWLVLAGMMGTIPMPERLIKKSWELTKQGMIVDFIDSQKYEGYLNSYNIGNCIELFLSIGAQQIKLYPTPRHNWIFFVVYKHSLWL